jgi:hypothetical protein
MADFHLIARRALPQNDWQVFNYHFLLGADSKLCCKRLGLDRGAFFHRVYAVEAILGKAYKDTQPFPLFPLSEYFEGPHHGVNVAPLPVPEPRPMKPTPLRPPLAARQPEPVPSVEAPETAPCEAELVPIVATDEASIVRLVRSWLATDVSLRSMAIRLNSMHAPCAGGKWFPSTVKKLLIDAARKRAA